MVYAFLVHSLNPGPCRVLFSSVFVHEQKAEELVTGGANDARSHRKEQILEIAQRVQSEYNFRYVASGAAGLENLTGFATTDELLSQLGSGVFRLPIESIFSTEKVVVWKGIANCGFTLVCEREENRLLAENVLNLMIKYMQDYCGLVTHPAEAILKADKVAAVLHHFLPNGQLLFMNHRLVRQLEKELEQLMSMK